jgi:hypothetical protein
MSEQQVRKAEMRAVFTEFLNVINWCDPCAADPLSFDELRSQGVFWLKETPPEFFPGRGRRPIMPPMGGARDETTGPVHASFHAQHWAAATASAKHFSLAYPRGGVR